MKCLSNFNCLLLKELDMLGKEPNLYYKGRTKKTSFFMEYSLFFLYISIFCTFPLQINQNDKKIRCFILYTYTYEAKTPCIQFNN